MVSHCDNKSCAQGPSELILFFLMIFISKCFSLVQGNKFCFVPDVVIQILLEEQNVTDVDVKERMVVGLVELVDLQEEVVVVGGVFVEVEEVMEVVDEVVVVVEVAVVLEVEGRTDSGQFIIRSFDVYIVAITLLDTWF